MRTRRLLIDADRFAALTRMLAAARSRRTLLAAGVAALPLFVGATAADAKKANRCDPRACRRQAGPCETARCDRGRCRISNKPLNARCQGDGRCKRGTCLQPPDCFGTGTPISYQDGGGTNSACCSDECDNPGGVLGTCTPSPEGARCRKDADCDAGLVCRAFSCRPA